MISLPGYAVANNSLIRLCTPFTCKVVGPALLSKVLTLIPQQQECYGLQMGPGGHP